jgi:hypothetical protein
LVSSVTYLFIIVFPAESYVAYSAISFSVPPILIHKFLSLAEVKDWNNPVAWKLSNKSAFKFVFTVVEVILNGDVFVATELSI